MAGISVDVEAVPRMPGLVTVEIGGGWGREVGCCGGDAGTVCRWFSGGPALGEKGKDGALLLLLLLNGNDVVDDSAE